MDFLIKTVRFMIRLSIDTGKAMLHGLVAKLQRRKRITITVRW